MVKTFSLPTLTSLSFSPTSLLKTKSNSSRKQMLLQEYSWMGSLFEWVAINGSVEMLGNSLDWEKCQKLNVGWHIKSTER